MALVTGTQTKYNMVGIREDLSDVIYRISPEDTVFLSGAGKGPKASNTYFEWQTDSLAAPDGANAHLEGDEAAFVAPAPTVRVGNQTQISKKTLIISGTAEAVTAAGRKSERALQIAKRGAELKRDMETIMFSNQGADAGSISVARKTATLGAWVKTNVSSGTGGVDPTYTSGQPSAGRTDGTQRALTETLLKNVIQQCWVSGNVPKLLSVGPVNKGKVSGFTGIATRNFDISNASPKPTAIIASADVFVSDFGVLRVVPSRFQRERDAWLLDFEYVSVSYLRPFRTEKLAKTGDAEKEQMLVEYGLRVNQEAALGLIADLTVT
jgi:hypothetical protein